MQYLIIILVFACFGAYFYYYDKKFRKWTAAVQLHDDMMDKYNELINDHLVTNCELANWLPIFTAADKICRKDWPGKEFDSITDMIRLRLYQDGLTGGGLYKN